MQDSDWPLRDGKGQLLPITSGVGVPVVVEGSLWGVMAVASSAKAPLPPGTEARLAAFTELIAMAIANAEAHDELSASRARVVASADETRRRIERDLHDGAQHRLVLTNLTLKRALQSANSDSGDVAELIKEAVVSTERAYDELRELARGLHPVILATNGLAPALKGIALRSPIPVMLDLQTHDRFPERIEVTAYYVTSEALTNAAKHSQASAVHVTLTATDGDVRLSISDDGIGGAGSGRRLRPHRAQRRTASRRPAGPSPSTAPSARGQNSWWSSRCDPYRRRRTERERVRLQG